MSKLKFSRFLPKKVQGLQGTLPSKDLSPKTGRKPSVKMVRIQVLSKDLKGFINRFKNTSRQDLREIDNEYLQLLQVISDVCVGVWRTRSKMIDPANGEPFEEAKRALRPLENTLDTLLQAGFEIRDSTNKPYVVGMLEKVVTWEQKEDLQDETIIETIRPTIVYHQEVLKNGEIVVGIPVRAKSI